MLKVGSYSSAGAPFHDWGNHQTSPSNNTCRGLGNSGANNSPLLSNLAFANGSLGNHEVGTIVRLLLFILIILMKLQRLREEATNYQAKMLSLEEDLSQARSACDVWRCRAMVAEQQRDEVIIFFRKNGLCGCNKRHRKLIKLILFRLWQR